MVGGSGRLMAAGSQALLELQMVRIMRTLHSMERKFLRTIITINSDAADYDMVLIDTKTKC